MYNRLKMFVFVVSAVLMYVFFPIISNVSAATTQEKQTASVVKKSDQVYAKAMEALRSNDPKTAITLLRQSARGGNPDAQYLLGLMYERGWGVEPDIKAAVKWLNKAAVQGQAEAQYMLGILCMLGNGVQQDTLQAINWFSKAAEQGLVESETAIGIVYLQGKGVKKDETKALEWLTKAAENGDPLAQYYLGSMYKDGQGVSANPEKSMYWYSQAAEQGYAPAQTIVGVIYLMGEQNVKPDANKGMSLLRRAAQKGEKNARKILTYMSDSGLSDALIEPGM